MHKLTLFPVRLKPGEEPEKHIDTEVKQHQN